MCGFVGVIGSLIPEKNLINNASEVLSHRGPDGKGIYTHTINEQSITLIHRRLSIIDLSSRSNQPFLVENHTLVFNGEIYNYIEIKDELINKGIKFKTDSDTEVLAKALIFWGIDAINKFEGMWSFAWYNEVNGDLILCRDRFGEKPLYYWQIDNSIYFGSEVKALAALSNKTPEINLNHLKRYLVNGFRSLYKTKETFHKNIYELPNATFLKFNSKLDLKINTYWSPRNISVQQMSYKEALKRTKDSLIKSVNLRLRSDVPIAFCMSGGIDSNSLISIAKRELGYDVEGFTILNRDERYEEQEFVNKSVKELGIKHSYVELSKSNFLEDLKKLIHYHDAPICTISYFVQWKLMNIISNKGYKVSISGTGADELFTGYYDHYNYYLNEFQNDKLLFNKSLKDWKKFQKPFIRNPLLKDIELFLNDSNFRDHLYLNNDIFSSYLLDNWKEDFNEIDFGYGVLRNRMLNELFVESVRVILNADDLNSMSYSIENRSPFLDKNLFETAYSIPLKYLIKNGYKKSILRDSMRGLVPDIILNNRNKVGFNAPLLELLDIDNKKIRNYLLDDSKIFQIVNKEKIKLLFKEKYLPNSYSKFLFNFINAKIFIDSKNLIF